MRPALGFLALVLATPLFSEEAARPRGTEDSDGSSKGLSQQSARAITAGIRYAPPAPTPPPEERPHDDADIPKNEIVRLPDMVVLGQRPAVFADRDLHSKGELDKFAKQRFLSDFDRAFLNRFGVPGLDNFSPEARARRVFLESERLRHIQETKDQVFLYRAAGQGDRAAKAEADAYSTEYRPSTSTTSRDGAWYGEAR